jgi:hypothetical protein
MKAESRFKRSWDNSGQDERISDNCRSSRKSRRQLQTGRVRCTYNKDFIWSLAMRCVQPHDLRDHRIGVTLPPLSPRRRRSSHTSAIACSSVHLRARSIRGGVGVVLTDQPSVRRWGTGTVCRARRLRRLCLPPSASSASLHSRTFKDKPVSAAGAESWA